MDPALTPALKWTIAGLAAVFVGLGSWLGVIVYRNQHPTATSNPSAAILPAAVSSGLTEPSGSNASSQSSGSGSTSSVSVDSSTKSSTGAGTNSSSSTTNIQQSTTTNSGALNASVATTSMNGQTSVTVASNLPVNVLVDGLTKQTNVLAATISVGSGQHTITVKSQDGQSMNFSVSGDSSSSTTNLNISSKLSS